MVRNKATTLDPIVEKQLEDIKNAKLWPNPDELGLAANKDKYMDLYKNWISQEEFARKIVDRRNTDANKDWATKVDYFTDKTQLQKAKTYANYIIGEKAKERGDKQKQHNKDSSQERADAGIAQQKRIDELKKLLNDAPEEEKKWLEKAIETLEKELGDIRQAKAKVIDDIKNSTNISAEIETKKEELRKLDEEKAKKELNFFATLPYEGVIDISKITSKMIRIGAKETDQRGRKKLVGYETMPLRMTRRRMTIKTIASKLNEIKDNEKDGVDFIMSFSKTRFLRYTRMEDKMLRRDILRKVNIGRNLETFGAKYAKKKQKMIETLTGGIKKEELPPEEEKVITAIERRMDFYKKKYLQSAFLDQKIWEEPKK